MVVAAAADSAVPDAETAFATTDVCTASTALLLFLAFSPSPRLGAGLSESLADKEGGDAARELFLDDGLDRPSILPMSSMQRRISSSVNTPSQIRARGSNACDFGVNPPANFGIICACFKRNREAFCVQVFMALRGMPMYTNCLSPSTVPSNVKMFRRMGKSARGVKKWQQRTEANRWVWGIGKLTV